MEYKYINLPISLVCNNFTPLILLFSWILMANHLSLVEALSVHRIVVTVLEKSAIVFFGDN